MPVTKFFDLPPIADVGTLRLRLEDVKYPLFRYMKEKYFGSFLLQGEVRLGTLYGYHDTEVLGLEIGDETEGVKADLRGEVRSVPYSYRGVAINSWCLSCCKAKDSRFFEKPHDYDCCFEITGPEYFIEIAKAAANKYLAGGLYNVQYEGIDRKPGPEMPLLLKWKRKRYSWQKEVRFCLEPWSPLHPREDIILEGDELIEKMKLVERLGWRGAAYSDPRNFPNLEPLRVFAPKAIQFTRMVERLK